MRFRIILLFISIAIAITAQSQSCYADLRAKGLRRLNSKNYAEAIDIFFRTRYCPDKPTKDDLDALIKKTQDAWVQELDNARREAERQRQIAENSLNRVNRLLSSTFYGNKLQTLNNIEEHYESLHTVNIALEHIEDSNQRLELLHQKARIFSNLNMYDSTIVILNKVLTEKPDYLFARHTRGIAYYYTFQTEACIAACDYLIERNAFMFISHFNKALCLARLGKYEDAVAVMKAAKYFYAEGDIAPYYFDQNLSEEIKQTTGLQNIYKDERAMAAMIELSINNFRTFRGDAEVLEKFELQDRQYPLYAYLNGINFLEIQSQAKPDDYGALALKAIYWEKAEYPAQAKQALADFVEAHEKNKDPRYDGFLQFVERKQLELSAEEAHPVAYTPAIQAVGIAIEARTREPFDAVEDQIAFYRNAMNLDPDNFYYRNQLMDIYLNQGDYRKLGILAKETLELRPNNPTARCFLAFSNYQITPDIDELERNLNQILEYDGYHPDTIILLSRVKEAQGKPEIAIQLLERYLQVFPGNEDILEWINALKSKN